jgi:hypothetical protein
LTWINKINHVSVTIITLIGGITMATEIFEVHINESVYAVGIDSYTPHRPPPMCSNPNDSRYYDAGDPEDVDFSIFDSHPDVDGYEDPEPNPDYDPYSDSKFIEEVLIHCRASLQDELEAYREAKAELQYDLLMEDRL